MEQVHIAESRFKRNVPEHDFTVDLDEMQTRSQAGENVDILDVFTQAVDNSVLDEILRLKRIPEDKQEEQRDRTRTQLGNAYHIVTFEKAVAEAPNIKAFEWRLSTLLDPEINERVATTYVPHPNWKLSTRFSSSVFQLMDFCAGNEELAEQAIGIWSEATSGIPRDRKQTYLETIGKGTEARARKLRGQLDPGEAEAIIASDHSILTKVVRDAMFKDGQTEKSSTSHGVSARQIVTALEIVPIAEIDLLRLVKLNVMLDAGVNASPLAPGKLVQSSAEIVRNMADSLAAASPEPKGSHAEIVSKVLGKLKRDGGALGVDHFITLANSGLVMKFIEGQQEFPVERLDNRSVTDITKAVDRVLFFVLEDPLVRDEIDEAPDKYELAAKAARQLAEKGVETRLKERVLTIGDLAIRKTGAQNRERVYA